MHIGFLLPEYPHPKIYTGCAGIGTASKHIVDGLLNQRVRVSVFIYGQEKDETISEGLLTIYKIQKNNFAYFGFYLYRKKLNKIINSIILRTNIDVLEAPDWTGITAFMKFPIPYILRLHGSDTYFCHLEKRKQKWKNFYFEKCAYKAANAIISVSKYTLELSEALFRHKTTSIVIPNGISLNLTENTEKFGPIPNTVLYYGSVIRKKGVMELAEAFNNLVAMNPQVQLQFLGRDVVDSYEKKSSLELFKAQLSERALQQFSYLGVVPYNEMNPYIQKAAVCVFPSLAESFGMVTIEAMLHRKAIVNTNYPWAQEIMEDGVTGYLVDPKDHLLCAEKINTLLKDSELAKSFGDQAHVHVTNHFSIEKITLENIHFYKKLLNDSSIS